MAKWQNVRFILQIGLITFNREAHLDASMNDHRRKDGIIDKLQSTSGQYGTNPHLTCINYSLGRVESDKRKARMFYTHLFFCRRILHLQSSVVAAERAVQYGPTPRQQRGCHQHGAHHHGQSVPRGLPWTQGRRTDCRKASQRPRNWYARPQRVI